MEPWLGRCVRWHPGTGATWSTSVAAPASTFLCSRQPRVRLSGSSHICLWWCRLDPGPSTSRRSRCSAVSRSSYRWLTAQSTLHMRAPRTFSVQDANRDLRRSPGCCDLVVSSLWLTSTAAVPATAPGCGRICPAIGRHRWSSSSASRGSPCGGSTPCGSSRIGRACGRSSVSSSRPGEQNARSPRRPV